MKTHQLPCLALLILGFGQCKKADTNGCQPFNFSLNDTVELCPNADATLHNGNTPLVVRLKSVIDDSRCPVDVDCVWAGLTHPILVISQEGLVETDTLELMDQPGNDFTDHVLVGGYKIKLISVSPEPHSGQTITAEDYRVKVQVTQ